MKLTASFGAGHDVLFLAEEVTSGGASVRPNKEPIVLYCDLAVDPKREQEMLDQFHCEFKPAAEKFDGFIDVKMLKFRKLLQGRLPLDGSINYRFQLTYQSEEKRQLWIASEVHKRVWSLIENTVTNIDYPVLLTDSM